MNKLEYIPGDLCIVKGKVESVCEVDRDNDFSITTDQHPFIRLSEVKPIPLTPEILEKNGWKKSKINDCAYYYYKDGLFLTYTSKDGKFWFDDFDYSSSICVELPYVHSLQHLLFGLGLNSEMEVWK